MTRLKSIALFNEISGAPKGHKSDVGTQTSLNFSQVHLSNTQISFVYQVFMFLLQTTANSSHGRCVYVMEITSTILITYIVAALPAPRCASGAHRK